MACPDMTMFIQPKTRSNWPSHDGTFIKKRTAYGLKFCRLIQFVSLYILFSRRVRKITKSDYQLPHVYLSVCPSAWNNSAPNGYTLTKFDLNIFRKSVHRVQVSLKTDNNNRYFTCSRPIYIYHHISLSSSYNEKCFRQNLQRKSKHTCYVT
jgi:hypothetical protein